MRDEVKNPILHSLALITHTTSPLLNTNMNETETYNIIMRERTSSWRPYSKELELELESDVLFPLFLA